MPETIADAVWKCSASDAEVLERIRSQFRERPFPTDLHEARAALAELTKSALLAENVVVEPLMLGEVPAERNVPESPRSAVACFLHGGAYVMGSPATHRYFSTRLARASACEVVVPDYRLAPEHPHPAPLEDALSAYLALLDSHPPDRITLVGESAGGGLAVGLLHTLVEKKLPLPSRFALINPWLDPTCSTLAHVRNAKLDFSLHRSGLLNAAMAYVGRSPLDDKVAFPLSAAPSGFPPGLVLCGGADILADDAVLFASLAREAGVEIRLGLLERMPHVWPAFVDQLESARGGLAAVAEFVANETQ